MHGKKGRRVASPDCEARSGGGACPRRIKNARGSSKKQSGTAVGSDGTTAGPQASPRGRVRASLAATAGATARQVPARPRREALSDPCAGADGDGHRGHRPRLLQHSVPPPSEFAVPWDQGFLVTWQQD